MSCTCACVHGGEWLGCVREREQAQARRVVSFEDGFLAPGRARWPPVCDTCPLLCLLKEIMTHGLTLFFVVCFYFASFPLGPRPFGFGETNPRSTRRPASFLFSFLFPCSQSVPPQSIFDLLVCDFSLPRPSCAAAGFANGGPRFSFPLKKQRCVCGLSCSLLSFVPARAFCMSQ